MFETGVGIRNPLFFVGIVEDGIDKRHENRVQVRAFGVHGTVDQIPTEDLPWALCVAGNYQLNILPLNNQWVFGVFLDGRDAQQPLILGTIPTFMSETTNPQTVGVGRHPDNADHKAIDGARPEKVGKPPMNDVATGEYTEETYVLEQEMNRIKDVNTGKDPDNPNDVTGAWSEPPTAYATKYPHNRVYDSPDGKTSIELDSTPGAERLMVWHKGSYIQIDSNGTRTDKSYGDHYEVNDSNNMVYIGGKSSVTIMGDSIVYVDGNKIEEINGDLIQVVHGNHVLGVGGQSTINASDEVQIRAGQLRLESNVAGINLKAAKTLLAQTGESMHFKSGQAIFQDAINSFNFKAGDNIFIQCDGDLNLKAENTKIETNDIIDIKAFDARIGGGGFVSIEATEVAIDHRISMANGDATTPGGASDATAADPSVSVEAPEPPAKSTSSTARSRNTPNVSTSGAASVDDTIERQSASTTSATSTTTPKFTTGRPSPGMTPEKAKAIREFAAKYNMSPEALAGILSIESNLDPNIQGGSGNNYFGIFQLQGSQIPGLTRQALGVSLTPEQYMNLSFEDQLKVYDKYISNAGASSKFFTGDAKQDASRLWALQLAPSKALSINYNNPNAVISESDQASSIEASQGLVTVGSVVDATIARGKLP